MLSISGIVVVMLLGATKKETALIDKVFKAVCITESTNNPNEYNKEEKAAGIAQIRPICLKDVNRISRKKFTLKDRWSTVKSRQMFHIYVTYYCKGNLTAERIARIWNGGPRGNKKKDTIKYWHKVKRRIK